MTDPSSMNSAPAVPEFRPPEFRAPEPWGYWATFGWGFLAFALGQAAALAVVVFWRSGDLAGLLANPFDGIAVTLFILVANPIMILIAVVAARLARWDVSDYLGLAWAQRHYVVQGLIGLVAVIAICDAVLFLMGHDLVTQFQSDSYIAAQGEGWLTAMWIAACVFAPAGEEVVFRGLLFRGWTRPNRPVWPAIVAISLVWSMLHIQYDFIGIAQIFFVGLFLGWTRWRSGSTLLTFLLHGLFNLEGTMETVLQLHYFS
jgi:hypothetical protein